MNGERGDRVRGASADDGFLPAPALLGALILWLTPLAFSYAVVNVRSLKELVLSVLLGAAIAAGTLPRLSAWVRTGALPAPRVDAVRAAVVVWWLAGALSYAALWWAGGAGREAAADRMLETARYGALALLMASVARDGRTMAVTVRGLIAVTAAVSAFALIQHAGLDLPGGPAVPYYAERVYGTLAHPNFLAGFLNFVLPLGAAWWVEELHGRPPGRRGVWGIAALAWLLLGIVCMIGTYSRAGWMGLLTGAACLAAGGWAGRAVALVPGGARPRRLLSLAAAGLAAAVMIGYGGPVVRRLEAGILDRADRSVSLRLAAWRGAVRLVREHPVVGQGIGTFTVQVQRTKPAETLWLMDHRNNVVAHAECEPLELAADQGAAGLLAWTVLLLVVARAGLRGLRRPAGPRRGLVLGTLAGLAALLVHNLACVNLRFPVSQMLFWTGVGWIAAWAPARTAAPPSRNRPARGRSWRLHAARGMAAAIVAGCGWQAWRAFSEFRGQIHFSRAAAWGSIGEAEWSVRAAPADWQAWDLLGQLCVSAEDWNRARTALDGELRLAPYFAPAWLDRARVALRTGEARAADEAIRTARTLEPLDERPMLYAALADVAARRWDRAAGAYREAVHLQELRAEFVDAGQWYNSGAALERMGWRSGSAGPGAIPRNRQFVRDRDIFYNLGVIATSDGLHDLALAALAHCAERHPGFADAPILSGDIVMVRETGRVRRHELPRIARASLGEARTYYRAAVAAAPASLAARQRLATVDGLLRAAE